MYFSIASLVLIPALLSRLAASIPVEQQEHSKSSIYIFPTRINRSAANLATCNRDNLYRSFIDPRYSSAANEFCSDLLRSKLSKNADTASTTLPNQSLPATTTYPASRLSSACSCILTSTPSTTQTTATQTCTDTSPILQNGDFETGSLLPWTILSSTPDPLSSPNFTYNITSPGHKSAYAFTMTDNAAASYVEVTIGQTISLCLSRTYRLSAQVYITDGGDTGAPRKEQYAELYVDDVLVASAPESFIQGPPRVGKFLGGEFTSSAKKLTAVVEVRFVATNLVSASWGVDDIVVVAI
ncbi:MAG: hypothetical protein Q9226_002242 [Calogaya cf. arnoldii]